MKSNFKSKIKRVLGVVGRIIVLFYIVVCCVLYFFMDKILFHGVPLSREHPFLFSSPFEEKWFSDGQQEYHSLYFKSSASKGVVLFFHGNAGNLEGWGEVAQELSRATNWDVWIVDYPGFGKTPGTIKKEQQLYSMAEAMWAEAHKKYSADRIVIYGRSLGSGVATYLAGQHEPRFLFLETPFKSVLSMVRMRAPFLPSVVIPFHFRSDEYLKKIDSSKVAIVHGTHDEVIPYSQSRELYEMLPRVQLYPIPNGRHNNLIEFPEFIRVRAKIFDALSE